MLIKIIIISLLLLPATGRLASVDNADFEICYKSLEYESECVSARAFVRAVRSNKDISNYFSLIDFDDIAIASISTRIDPLLIVAMAYRESNFKSAATSIVGAQGVMQIMPRTRQEIIDLYGDMDNDYLMGAVYLAHIKNANNFDWVETVAAYNEGPTRVRKRMNDPGFAKDHQYVDRVFGTFLELKKTLPSSSSRSIASIE
jgi:soluble lytic murein transglycosylase-like protein